jgi:hypothetical protein
MKNSHDKMSETMSIRNGGASQISTPRLTPLKMIDRNRNQLVSKDDIDNLEIKIKELEDQIMHAKNKGDEKTIQKGDQQGTLTDHDRGQQQNQLTKENLLFHDNQTQATTSKDHQIP